MPSGLLIEALSIEEVAPVECTLIASTFDYVVQIVLGVCAFAILIVKRQLEPHPRSWKVWGLDCGKQALAGLMMHFINIGLAEALNAATVDPKSDQCDFYFVNFMLDVVLGLILSFGVIKVYNWVISLRPCYRRFRHWELRRCGDYDDPPRYAPFMLQLVGWLATIFVTKVLMSVIEYEVSGYIDAFGFNLFGWLAGFPRVKLVLVMVAAPLLLNMAQFWLVDSFLKAPVEVPFTGIYKSGSIHHTVGGYKRNSGDLY